MANTKWALDPTHSEVHFKVRHLVSHVSGLFKKFDATVETEGDDISTAKVHFTADIESISTNNEQRDGHLKTGDFFDVANHPQLIFNSTSMQKVDDENYNMHGVLEMRGVKKDIVLHVTFGGIAPDPWGNMRSGFGVTGKINRMDYGVSFGGIAEAGTLVLGHDVTISANAELVKEKVAELV